MGALGLSAALVAGAGLKVGYDLTLFGLFRRLRPPEEQPVPGQDLSAEVSRPAETSGR
jgi:hypothetical protein